MGGLAMRPGLRTKVIVTVLGWGAAALLFFPIFWMVLTGFKTEVEAVSTPPSLLFEPTLENYAAVQQRAASVKFAFNSGAVSLGATVLALAFLVPAAYALAFFPSPPPQTTRTCSIRPKFTTTIRLLFPYLSL